MKECFLDEQNREMIGTILLLIVLLVEAWLGKTNQVRAGSILELIFARLMVKKQPEQTLVIAPEQPKEIKNDPNQSV